MKNLGLVALAAVAALVLGFGALIAATMIRAGPLLDHTSSVATDTIAPIATDDVAAVTDNGLVAPLTNIGEISSTTAAGMGDGLGTGFATLAALPLLCYIAALIAIAGMIAFLKLDGDVGKDVRKIGGAAFRRSLSVGGYAITGLGIAIFALSAAIASDTGLARADGGGYSGQDSSSFPLWTLVALSLGGVALAIGGMFPKKVAR